MVVRNESGIPLKIFFKYGLEKFMKYFPGCFGKVHKKTRKIKLEVSCNIHSIKAGQIPWSPKYRFVMNNIEPTIANVINTMATTITLLKHNVTEAKMTHTGSTWFRKSTGIPRKP